MLISIIHNYPLYYTALTRTGDVLQNASIRVSFHPNPKWMAVETSNPEEGSPTSVNDIPTFV